MESKRAKEGEGNRKRKTRREAGEALLEETGAGELKESGRCTYDVVQQKHRYRDTKTRNTTPASRSLSISLTHAVSLSLSLASRRVSLSPPLSLSLCALSLFPLRTPNARGADRAVLNMRAPASFGITPTTASTIPRHRVRPAWGLREGPGRRGTQELTVAGNGGTKSSKNSQRVGSVNRIS